MWNTGIGHGFLMGVGWLLATLVLGGVVYAAVRLALRHTVLQIEQRVEEAVQGRPHNRRPPKA